MGYFKELSIRRAEEEYANEEYRDYHKFRGEEDSASDNEVKSELKERKNEDLEIKQQHDLLKTNNHVINDYLPDSVFKELPQYFNKVIKPYEKSNRDRDIVFTSTLTTLSACFPEISTEYDKNIVYSNLFSIILAPPASGKGYARFGVEIANDIHESIKSRLYNNQGQIDVSNIPSEKEMNTRNFFISANSSTAALLEEMKSNSKIGNLIFESELDIASSVSKQDWGGMYSEMFRKAFHHERISSSRKKDGNLEIDTPKLSALFTGTPSQVKGFVRSIHDGLFSRFIFYSFTCTPKWKDVSPKNSNTNIEIYKKELSKELLSIFNWFAKKKTKFNLTKSQWDIHYTTFSDILNDVTKEYGEEVIGTVQRLGLIAIKTAMILSALRAFENKNTDNEIICDEKDFTTAMTLCETFLLHALTVYKEIQGPKFERASEQKEQFYNNLPEIEFSRAEAVSIGKNLNMSERTIDNMLKDWIGSRFKNSRYGFYIKY